MSGRIQFFVKHGKVHRHPAGKGCDVTPEDEDLCEEPPEGHDRCAFCFDFQQ